MDLVIVILIIFFWVYNSKSKTKKPPVKSVKHAAPSGLFTAKELSGGSHPLKKKSISDDIAEGFSAEGKDLCSPGKFVSMEGEDPCHPAESQTKEEKPEKEEDAYAEKELSEEEREFRSEMMKGIIWSEILKRKY